MIRRATDVAGGFTARTDVCIIGSGAGGGVAAGLLAEAGREVLVLEEGAPVTRFTQREEEMYPALYRDGGNQFTDDGGVNVLQGRTLGGSTVINMADVVGIPDGVLAHWAQRYGWDRYSPARVREAEAACSAVIGANPIPRDQLNRNNAVLVAGGERLGLPVGTFTHNRVGCIGSGYCLVGCAYGAKQSVALTWVPRAQATGRALFQTDARVSTLEWQGRQVRAAVGTLLDPATARPIASFRVQADQFILAAGAIHSPLVLQAAGIGGRQVGRNLSLQPQAPVVALFPDEIVHYRGVPQAGYVDQETADPATGLGGFRLEGVSGTPGMSATSMGAWGPELHTFMRRYRDIAACLCLVPDQPSGAVTRKDDRPKIRYALGDAWVRALKEALWTAGRAYFAAGAEVVVLPLVGATPARTEDALAEHLRLPIRSAGISLISAHPQGTCRAGEVLEPDLRVKGLDNLRVIDASVFPSTASSHTMLPVMTMSWLATQDLLG